jgi:hypothetical protein
MGDSTLLYIGMFCFALVILAMVLTIYEFKKMSHAPAKSLRRGMGATSGAVIETGSIAHVP